MGSIELEKQIKITKFILHDRSKIVREAKNRVQEAKISVQADLYEPCLVTIGIFYMDRKDEKLREHKNRLLCSFEDRNTDLSLADYSEALEGLLFDLEHHDTIVFDGCFILELFLKWLEKAPDVLFNQRRDQRRILSDLLLVDNQIPFVVIELVYDLLKAGGGPTSSTMDGSSLSWTNLERAFREPTNTRNAFLNLLARFLVGEEVSHIYPSSVPLPETETIDNLLDLCHKFLRASLCQDGENHQTITSPDSPLRFWKAKRPPQIPCATELYKEAGIKFKKKKSPKNFLDVTFSRGILEIPVLLIDDNTKALLVNLATLEAGKTLEEQIITSYVVLMDSLIDTEGDVELLQRNGVIRNILSTHHDAAIFFNKLGGSLPYDTVNHHFANLFKEVQLFYESKWNRSWARLMLDYLNNPWAIISVIAGVILLCLTILQTFYTVFPYYRPH